MIRKVWLLSPLMGHWDDPEALFTQPKGLGIKVAEHLPSMWEALSSNHSIVKDS